ncbi:LysE family transporter [Alicyclobacillus cycloheptanicus]|nr:LysE family transporter [Alicyclobacillus cycloheptanicus]
MTGFLLSLSLCLDLGIVNVAIITTGLERGFLPSFCVGFGSSFGDLMYAVLSMAGISALLQFAAIRWVLWIGGTIVLLWFSMQMVRESIRPGRLTAGAAPTADAAAGTQTQGTAAETAATTPAAAATGGAGVRDLLTGLGLALSSPTSILWFATVGGSIIAADDHHGTPEASLLKLFLGFFCAGVGWSGAIAFVSGQLGRRMGPALLRLLSLTFAGLFLYFAMRVFLNGLHTLPSIA